MVNYPVSYNELNGSIDDKFGRTLAIVNWQGRARTMSVVEINAIGEELTDFINAGQGTIGECEPSYPSVTVNEPRTVTPEEVRQAHNFNHPTENQGSIRKAINFVRRKFINEKGEVVELSGSGRPRKGLRKLTEKELKELEYRQEVKR